MFRLTLSHGLSDGVPFLEIATPYPVCLILDRVGATHSQQTERQTGRKTDGLTDRETDRPADRLTEGRMDSQIDRQTDMDGWTDRLAVRITGY